MNKTQFCFKVCVEEYCKKNGISIKELDPNPDDRKDSLYKYMLIKNGNKQNPIYGEDFCCCETHPELHQNEITQRKLQKFKMDRYYNLFHFLAQNYDPPITDEEMAQQLPF